MISVNMLVEGKIDEIVAKRLLNHIGLEAGNVYGRRGKAHLLERLPNYNEAAKFTPWFVIVDLDMDTKCASQALELWLPNIAKGMRFRIAVRAIEAWLMADKENIARFLAVATSKIQLRTDLDLNPKETLVNIALYVARLTEFTEKHWRPDEAADHSESLRRCISALSTLTSWET